MMSSLDFVCNDQEGVFSKIFISSLEGIVKLLTTSTSILPKKLNFCSIANFNFDAKGLKFSA